MNKAESLLDIRSPWMNAAGFMGYMPLPLTDERMTAGAFVTNPISYEARAHTHHRAAISFPGGILIHTANPNHGIRKVLKQFGEKWKHLPVPVWPHLLVQTPYDSQQMARLLEETENVIAIELALPPDVDKKEQADILLAAQGELPVYVCVPLDTVDLSVIEDFRLYGAAGIVLTAPRGILKANGKNINGRLYGPCIYPQLLKTLYQLREIDLPIIAGGGIFSYEQGEEVLTLGASAVQVDVLFWKF